MLDSLTPPENTLLPRRHFLQSAGLGLGGIALAEMLGGGRAAGATAAPVGVSPAPALLPHFAPKAKRVIYLFMSGGPSQLDLFDYKPALVKRNGEQLPDSVRPSSLHSTVPGARGSANCCPTPPRWRGSCA
jgi:hypothetical protein